MFYTIELDEFDYVAYDIGWTLLIFWIVLVNIDFVFVLNYTVNYGVSGIPTNYIQQKGIGVGLDKGKGRGKAHISR